MNHYEQARWFLDNARPDTHGPGHVAAAAARFAEAEAKSQSADPLAWLLDDPRRRSPAARKVLAEFGRLLAERLER